MITRVIHTISAFALICIFGNQVIAQDNVYGLEGRRNVITTAVPFLTITPDSRSGGLGEAGVAIAPDVNTIHWNPAKLAYMPHDFGFGLSYTPWLRAIVQDINLSYLSGYKKIDDLSGFGGSLRYFSLGDIQFTNEFGEYLKDFRPYEFAFDAAYARKLSDNFSMGLAIRYIHSNLAGNLGISGGVETRPGNAIAGDISFYYTKEEAELFGQNVDYSFGANFSNIGSKITYTDNTERDFLPMNMKLGTWLNFHIDDYNEIAVTFDINKLLVPTPPIYDTAQGTGAQIAVAKGYNPDVPVIQGMLQSFYDAPGGFKEEMKEINPSIGFEYWYDKQFAFRAGYFYENPTKGARQYITVGAGIRYNVFGLDVAYLVPTNTANNPGSQSPLANTIRISLLFNFDEGSKK